MAISIDAVMREINNAFEAASVDGVFSVSGGAIADPAIPAQGLIAIKGSANNDGVHDATERELIAETFEGVVWILHPPSGFLALCEEISAYDDANPVGAMTHESFGPYSYTKATGADGGVLTWREAFADRLRPYRRMFSEVL